MAQNIGTLVSAAIRPNDEFDPIATAYGNEIKGGLHSYETLDEVYLIITSRRQWGMLVTVYNDGYNNGVYQLKYDYFSNIITDNENWIRTSYDYKSATEWIDSVISIRTTEPTLSPDRGDRYLLGTTSSVTPSGIQWITIAATTIVEYNDNSMSWDITYPTNGMTVRVDSDNNTIYKYEGSFPYGEWKLEKITNVFYIEPGSVNGITYSTTTSPQFTSYTNDLIFLTKFFIPNVGSASLNINGIGYKQIKIATNSGLRDLILSDINTSSVYSLSYNGTYFQLTKPFPNDAYNIEFYIAPTETMTIGDSDQYWVYGDLTIAGTMVNYGKVIVANGSVILEGSGSLNNQGDGELILVDLFNTPTFNTTSTIQMSSEMTLTGPSVSSTIVSNSITTDLLNTVGSVTANYILSNDGGGSFQWIAPTLGGSSNLFYNIGGTVSATNSTTSIYRTGSINIGTGTATDGRFVVSSTGGTVSLVVDESGSIYNYSINLNTKFGYQALNSATSSLILYGGQGCVAIGYQALYSTTSGSSNTALGAVSLYSNTTGNGNVAVGFVSLSQNTTGYNNVAVGSNTLSSNTTGYFNIAVGNSALSRNITGYNNIAIGWLSGNIISGTGDINTGTGATNSNSSIFIGYFTCPSAGNNTNEIVIGYGATGSGSNSVTLGADTITKTQLRGTINISSVLEYADNATALSNSLVVGDVYRTGDLLKIVH